MTVPSREALTTFLASIAALALAVLPMPAHAIGASPPSGGTISIELRTDQGNDDASLRAFKDAAAAALTARGFTVFDDPGHAASVVQLTVNRGDVGTGLARAPGERAISPIGTGVSIPLSTGASQLVALRRTRLEMRFRRRGAAATIWDGVSMTVRQTGSRNGTDDAVAADLTRALLRSYPAQPKDVVGVP